MSEVLCQICIRRVPCNHPNCPLIAGNEGAMVVSGITASPETKAGFDERMVTLKESAFLSMENELTQLREKVERLTGALRKLVGMYHDRLPEASSFETGFARELLAKKDQRT